MADFKVGKITHFFDKIMVAVVEITDSLAVGDTIKIVTSDREFQMQVESMQVEHQNITEAKKGDTVGMKVTESIKGEAEVYRVS